MPPLSFKRIIDISLPIREGMITYPGNPEVAIRTFRSKTSFISSITMGSHAGTHVDAPKHAFQNGYGADRIPTEALIGPCRVLDLTKAKGSIEAEDLRGAKIRKGERILLKTSNSKRGFKEFHDDYVHLSGEAARLLAEAGAALVGLDALSVKKRGSEDNSPHIELLEKKVVIFEGLDLSKVKPGNYFFAGLPLRIEGLDGAPARAVLLA